MLFVVVIGSFEFGDLLLPIGVKNVAIVTRESLIDLKGYISASVAVCTRRISVRRRTFPHGPVNTSGGGA